MNKQRKYDEFRGFFYADGCVSLHKRRQKSQYVKVSGEKSNYWNTLYTVRLSVSQRIDNLPLIKEIQREFGGYLYLSRPPKNSQYTRKMCVQWSVQGVTACYPLLKILLDTQFEYRSKDSVRAAYEYCDWKTKRGSLQVKLTDEDEAKIDEWIVRLKEGHKFSEKYQGLQVID